MPSDPDQFELIVSYLSGDLAASAASRFEADRAESAELDRRVGEVERLLQRLGGAALEHAPSGAIRRVKALLAEPHGGVVKHWMDEATRLVARLVFDSRQQPAVAGFRGAARPLRLAWEVEGCRLDLEAVATTNETARNWTIRGQVDAATRRAGRISLIESGTGTPVADGAADEHGHFRLDAPIGRFDLLVGLDDESTAIVAGGIELS